MSTESGTDEQAASSIVEIWEQFVLDARPPSLPSSPPSSSLDLPDDINTDSLENAPPIPEFSPDAITSSSDLQSLLDLPSTLQLSLRSSDQLNQLIWDGVGQAVAVGLGLIPGVGPVIGTVFAFMWDKLGQTSSSPNPLIAFHNRIIAYIGQSISLNNVQEQIRRGKEKLEGIETVGREYRQAYQTWKQAPGDTHRKEVLRMEFITLKNMLLEATSIYWAENSPRYLLHMGCVVSTMIFALLRDVAAQGTQWGFGTANIQDFHTTMRAHRDYVVARCRSFRELDFTSAATFLYIHPTFRFLGNGRRSIKLLITFQQSRAVLSADAVHVVNGWSLMNESQSGVQVKRTAFYSGLSHQSALLVPIFPNPNSYASGVITFNRDGIFDIRILITLSAGNGHININGKLYPYKSLPADPEERFFFIIRGIKTIGRKIQFMARKEGPNASSAVFLADFIITPS